MPTHTLLSGELLEYDEPSGELAAYLNRMRNAVDDPTVDEHRFVELLYSPENPLLDPQIMPGRGTVTKATFANPIYHLMQDLLGRKRIVLGTLDMEKVRARYSLTVKEAAERAGVHESAIRQAIAARRLSSVKDGARHMLDPDQVAAWKPTARGPAAPLEVFHGSEPGKRLTIKHDGTFVELGGEGEVKHARIEGWTRAAVIAGTKEKARFWEIEPGAELDEIGFRPFHVRGRFDVRRKINDEERAREAFRVAFKKVPETTPPTIVDKFELRDAFKDEQPFIYAAADIAPKRPPLGYRIRDASSQWVLFVNEVTGPGGGLG